MPVIPLEKMHFSLFILPFVGLITTVLGVDSDLINCTVYGKYIWFYISVGLTTLSSCYIGFTKHYRYDWNIMDLFVCVFIAYISFHFFLSDAGAINKLSLLLLLTLGYFNLRILFSYHSHFTLFLCLIFVLSGVVESIWGMLQLYGVKGSYNANFRMTGSFFNPGPFGGYLAMVFPMALHLLLKYRSQIHGNRISASIFFTACLSVVICGVVLPASMSRSAWLALFCGSLYVIVSHIKMKTIIQVFYGMRFKVLLSIFVTCVLSFAVIGAFYLKKGSAESRLLTNKISISYLFSKEGWRGAGLGHFAEAYAKAQASNLDGLADNDPAMAFLDAPEYAFNEYLQLGIEIGIPGLLLYIFVLVFAFREGIKNKQNGAVGALVSLSVFSLFSYPFSILPFSVVFVFLITLCVVREIPGTIRKKAVSPYFQKIQSVAILIVSAVLLYRGYMFVKSVELWSEIGNIPYEKRVYVYQENYDLLKDQYNFLLAYGKHLNENGYYTKSNKILGHAKRYSCNPVLYTLSGDNYQKMKYYSKADSCYEEAYRIVPNRLYPLYLLAHSYREQGDTSRMKEMAYRVVFKQPKFPTKWARDMKKEMLDFFKDSE